MIAQDFASKLELALKAVSISRGQLAMELGVGKSMVSRWVSGVNAPSSLNVVKLTQLIALRRPGFTVLDWDRDLSVLAERLSEPTAAPPSEMRLSDYLPASVLEEAIATSRLRAHAYAGFWRSTRPANDPAGGFFHDQIMMWPQPGGLLRFRLGVYDMRFEGWTMPVQTQLFSMASDPVTGVFMFSIFNAVLRNRAEILDGLTLTCQRDAGGTPVAAACLMERVGDLSGDLAADEARFRDLANANPVAPEGSVPQHVRDHLYKDVGPTSFAAGGAPLLVMSFAQSMSRGAAFDPPA